MGAIPLVQWECTTIGTDTASRSAVTSSQVTCGERRPEVSLTTTSSEPISARPLASEHQSCSVWAGLMA